MKRCVLLTILGTFIFLSGCENKDKTAPSNPPKDEVIDMHGQVENRERLDAFVENVQSSLKDKIRLTRYTIEGDPIYHDLDFDGTLLNFRLDTTEDQFGQGNVTTYECKQISKSESDTETKYLLDGCANGQTGELLTISHNVEMEDYFEFELKYGKNEIDTKEMVLTKDLKNGEMLTINDFQLSTEQMNRIYKELVYANYLQPKSLSNSCNEKSNEDYELYVWINSATRNFQWSSCDQSEDGLEMTNLVEKIIDITEETL